MKVHSPVARPGRPRAFDADVVLERAMKVFWEKGYEGASMADLTAAMGINRPSLYAAFGNKEALFRKVLDRYGGGPASYVCAALSEPTARAVMERLLLGTVDLLTKPGNPRGCLVLHGALVCSDGAAAVKEDMAKRRCAVIDSLRKRFVRARKAGDLPADADPASLARYVSAVAQGMSVQATAGATRRELLRVVETAMRAWPA